MFDVVLRLLKASWLAGLGMPRRQFLLVFTLLFNSFTWYYVILFMMESTQYLLDAFRAVFYISTIGAGFAGVMLSQRVRQVRLLYLWMIVGTVASLPLAWTNVAPNAYLSIMFILAGVSFGVGMPSCLGYLANGTSVENRGKTSALIFAFVNLAAFPIGIILSTTSLATTSLVLTLWRAVGLVAFASLKPSDQASVPRQGSRLTVVFHDRSLVLYLIPWLMFSIIDALEKALFKDFLTTEYNVLALTVQPVVAGLSMLIGGLLSDRVGRKRVVMYGFVSLGVAYAILGIAPTLSLAWNIYLIVDAIAAGILWIVFIMILWGDLSTQDSREKYYVIGSLPFLATAAIPLSLVPLSEVLQATTAFSLASFFLFLAVLPLMYAPETLPQKKMELHRLRSYMEQAKKLAGKYTDKKAESK